MWIDTDPMIGELERDVSDAFALVQAFNSSAMDVRGVSAVFGSAPLVQTWPVLQDLADRFGPAGLRPWRGSEGPHERNAPTEASEALATALRNEPLVIVALGPLTNIASTLKRSPELSARIVRVVALTGRRDGIDVAASTDGSPGSAVSPRRDVAVDLDVESARVVLESDVPLTLAPLELASTVWMTEEDLERLAQGPSAARFLAETARGWFRLVTEAGDTPGFHPYETLAVDLAGAPDHYACIEGTATIEHSDGAQLVVRDAGDGRMVTYCHRPDAGFKARLLETLLGGVRSRSGNAAESAITATRSVTGR